MANSMLNAISAPSVAVKALMREYSAKNSVWVFVEGPTDAATLSKFLDSENVKVEAAGSKSQAIDALKHYLSKRISKSGLAIVDADYDHIMKISHGLPELFLTDCTDLVTQAFESPATRYLLCHIGLQPANDVEAREQTYKWTTGLGYLRLSSYKNRLMVSFDAVSIDWLDKEVNEIIQLLIKTQPKGKGLTDAQLIAAYDAEFKEKHASHVLCQGHDICKALCKYVLQRGSKGDKSGQKYIESILLASYDSADFEKTNLYKRLSKWETDNKTKLFKASDVQSGSSAHVPPPGSG